MSAHVIVGGSNWLNAEHDDVETRLHCEMEDKGALGSGKWRWRQQLWSKHQFSSYTMVIFRYRLCIKGRSPSDSSTRDKLTIHPIKSYILFDQW